MGTSFDDYINRLEEEEQRELEDVAEHLDCDIKSVVSYRPPIRENLRAIKLWRKGWIVKKTVNGEQYETVAEIKHVKGKVSKKTGEKYQYGRIQINVPVEWAGYTAKVIVSKKVTPKMVHHKREVKSSELRDIDTSKIAEIVYEENTDKTEEENVREQLIKVIMERKGVSREEAMEYLDETSS